MIPKSSEITKLKETSGYQDFIDTFHFTSDIVDAISPILIGSLSIRYITKTTLNFQQICSMSHFCAVPVELNSFSVMTKINIYFTIFHQGIWIRIKINCLYSHLLLAEFCLTSGKPDFKPTWLLVTSTIQAKESVVRKGQIERNLAEQANFFSFFPPFVIAPCTQHSIFL